LYDPAIDPGDTPQTAASKYFSSNEVALFFYAGKIIVHCRRTGTYASYSGVYTYTWASLMSFYLNLPYGVYDFEQAALNDVAAWRFADGDYWYMPLAGVDHICRITGTYPYSASGLTTLSMVLRDTEGTILKTITCDLVNHSFRASLVSYTFVNYKLTKNGAIVASITGDGGDGTYRKWAIQMAVDWDCLTESTMVMPFTIKMIDIANQASADLSDVVEFAFLQAGLDPVGSLVPDYDLSALVGIECRGYTYSASSPAISFVQQLMSAYNFFLIEKDWTLTAVLYGGPVVANIPQEDLGATDGSDQKETHYLVSRRTEDKKLPAVVRLSYKEIGADFASNTVYAARSRDAIQSDETVDLSFPVVMDAAQAKQAVVKYMMAVWARRIFYEFNLGPKYLKLQAGDVAMVAGIKMFFNSQVINFPGLLNIQALSEYTGVFTADNAGSIPFIETNDPISMPKYSFMILLDIPLLTLPSATTALGIYAAGYGTESGWSGGLVISSVDGGQTWVNEGLIPGGSVVGQAVTALSAGPYLVIDEANSVTIKILTPGGVLTSVSRDALLAGTSSTFALGVHGRWEILSFEDAALNEDGTYTLSGLIRGRQGTENNIGNHAVGDLFVLLGGNLQYVQLADEEISQDIGYRMIGNNSTYANALMQTLSCQGQAIKPWAPCHILAGRDGSGNLAISWTRRSRIDQGWILPAEAPLLETTEAYEIDVYDGADVVRTIEVSEATTATYTATDQATDFGSAQSSIDIIIYQLGRLGRGIGRSATL
jgi:hypothetical protein